MYGKADKNKQSPHEESIQNKYDMPMPMMRGKRRNFLERKGY